MRTAQLIKEMESGGAKLTFPNPQFSPAGKENGAEVKTQQQSPASTTQRAQTQQIEEALPVQSNAFILIVLAIVFGILMVLFLRRRKTSRETSAL